MGTLFIIICLISFAFPDSVGYYLGINNGYSYFFAVFLYFTGKTIKKHEKRLKESITLKKSLVGYIVICFFTACAAIALLLCHRGDISWKLFSYNAPLVYIGSVFFFLYFLNIQGHGRLQEYIGQFGVNVFGVYILHSMPLLRSYRFYLVNSIVPSNNIFLDFVIIIGYCLILFTVCLVISRTRYYVMKYITLHKS